MRRLSVSRRRHRPGVIVVEALEDRTLLAAPNPVDLSSLDGGDGFILTGIEDVDQVGYSVSNAGDVNGDGFDDLIIGALRADSPGGVNAGETYIVFGAAGGFPASMSLADLDGTNGFVFNGAGLNDESGNSANTAGDINGDGFDDIIIGAPVAGDTDTGEAYVVYGHSGNFPAALEPADLDGTNGFVIVGVGLDDRAGNPVGSAGDVNGDGFDDLVLSANFASEPGHNSQGASYVVFGRPDPFPALVELSTLDGTDGFVLFGVEDGDGFGRAASSAGDVNGDGYQDILFGAWFAEQPGDDATGETYVVFGGPGGFAPVFHIADLDGTNGFTVAGIGTRDRSGRALSSAGDVNGDGYDDIITGSLYRDNGEAYVIFGHAGAFPALIEAETLDGTVGFTIVARDVGSTAARSLSGAGDVNGDGFDDMLIGDPYADGVGEVYLVFGHAGAYPAVLDLDDLDGTNGFRLAGAAPDDLNIGRNAKVAGDVNGDGFDDLIIGGHYADHSGGTDQGKAYIVFGGNFTGGVETQVGDGGANTLTATQGAVVDILIGGRGNDTLISDGGADVLRGGEGNDILVIPDTDFSGTRRLQGGNGIDTLRLDGSGNTLVLTAIADNRITDIEQIDIRGSGPNALALNVLEVLNISTHSNTLVVRGDADDTVKINSGWTQQADEILFGETFEVFTQGAAILKVEAVADIDPGRTDVISRNADTGTVVVGVSTGTGFATKAAAVVPPGADWSDLVTGDFNRDGFLDLAGLSPSDGQWRVLLATPDGFADAQIWGQWTTSVTFSDILVGDFNNDGRDDVAALASTGTWVVGLSDGTQFATSSFGAWSTTAGFGNVQTGDFNGDGRADIAGLAANGRWVVGLSDGSRFAMSSFGVWSTTAGFDNIQTGDFDGDGRTDIAALSASGKWVVGLSDGARFAFSVFAQWSTTAGFDNIRVGDFNGDGKSDIAALATNGTWVVGLSGGDRFALSAFGMWSTAAGFDNILVGDFNGDGKSDIAGFSASGKWVVALSDGTRFANSLFTTWSSTANWDNITAGNFA